MNQRISCHYDRSNDRGTSNYHQRVEDIATHHVTNGNVSTSLQCRRYRNSKFWSRSSESHNREAYHDVRDMKSLRQCSAAVCQTIGS